MNAPTEYTAGFGPDQVDLVELATQIADQAARETIESLCPDVVSGERTWYDTSFRGQLEDWHLVDRALAYLTRRGAELGFVMVRSLAFPKLVRFEGK